MPWYPSFPKSGDPQEKCGDACWTCTNRSHNSPELQGGTFPDTPTYFCNMIVITQAKFTNLRFNYNFCRVFPKIARSSAIER